VTVFASKVLAKVSEARETQEVTTNETSTAYITSVGGFLPGPVVTNDEMEAKLGFVGGTPSRYRESVLKNNGIEARHYAIDEAGNQTHLNEEMAALAIGDAVAKSGVPLSEISMLAVGTTMPDLLMPGFASMVHGRLAENDPSTPPMEILSAAGICASGAAALRHAINGVRLGDHQHTIAAASELPSVMMKASRFEQESVVAESRDEVATAYQYFNADFLRWMLSDGAGATVISNRPHASELSLRVDWIDLTSYANEQPTCMFMGTSDPRNISVGNTWLGKDSATAADADGMMVIRQDTKLLAEQLLSVGTAEGKRLVKAGKLDPDVEYDWFLPHMSSYFFKDFIRAGLAEVGMDIPNEKVFTNLKTRGNTGSASIYLMLEEALSSGLFKAGDRILAFVPESGRFAMSFMQFTAVGPE
jgi:3-oxoacyl-[acyl-carrier-protein] synthase-3